VEGLGPAKLIAITEELSIKFHHEIGSLVNGEMDLRELVRVIMFPAVVKQMFGDDLLPDERVMLL